MAELAKKLILRRPDPADATKRQNLCGLQSKDFSIANAVIEQQRLKDCQDTDSEVIVDVSPGAQTISFSGSGIFETGDAGTFIADAARTQAVTQLEVFVPGYGVFDGEWLVENFQWTGELEGDLNFSAGIRARGSTITFTPVAAPVAP